MKEKKYTISIFMSIIFLLLLSSPLLNIFNSKVLIWGIPTLLFYILLLWIVFIALLIWITYRSKNQNS